jgi:hypothetical protein
VAAHGDEGDANEDRRGAAGVSEISLTIVFFVVAAGGWLGFGVLRAIRDALSERAADWLLPGNQPVTFRLAQFVVFLAAALAPRRLPRWSLLNPYAPMPSAWFVVFPVVWDDSSWSGPESILAELEADLRAERRVLDPVRLVFPLLRHALLLRGRYLWKLAACVLWIPPGLLCFAVLVVIMALVAIFDDEVLGIVGFVRRRLRRASGRSKTRARP